MYGLAWIKQSTFFICGIFTLLLVWLCLLPGLVSVVAHSCHCNVASIAPLLSIQHVSQDTLLLGFPEFLSFGTVKTFLNVSGNFSRLCLSLSLKILVWVFFCGKLLVALYLASLRIKVHVVPNIQLDSIAQIW